MTYKVGTFVRFPNIPDSFGLIIKNKNRKIDILWLDDNTGIIRDHPLDSRAFEPISKEQNA